MSDLKNNAPRVAHDGIRDGELSIRLATPEPVILDTDTKEMDTDIKEMDIDNKEKCRDSKKVTEMSQNC